MPDTYPPARDERVGPSIVNPLARRRGKFAKPLRVAHPGERCRTLFPEFLLACVPTDGLLSLGERAAVHAAQAPAFVAWLGALIAGELSRRQDTPWRGLPRVAAPIIPSDQSGPGAQVLRGLFLHFDAWSQVNASGAAQVADLLAAVADLANHGAAEAGRVANEPAFTPGSAAKPSAHEQGEAPHVR
jgi:hypothetical protein